MTNLQRSEKSCPEEGPHRWFFDVLINRTVCARCGILERWLAEKQLRDHERETAKRLLK
jgi:hypothetical protein